ncbi:MAG: hypothetical protein ACPGJU_03040 [Coraliomargarita sp.]
MKEMLWPTLGELGFDRVRFSKASCVQATQGHGCYAFGLAEVLPLLIRVSDKSHLNINILSDRLISEIVNVCANTRIDMAREVDLEDCLVVSLKKQHLTLSCIHPCGLRDLIFSACLFRTYAYMGAPDNYNLDELIAENWLMLADELPQSLTYSTAADINEHVREHRAQGGLGEADIHFYAA